MEACLQSGSAAVADNYYALCPEEARHSHVTSHAARASRSARVHMVAHITKKYISIYNHVPCACAVCADSPHHKACQKPIRYCVLYLSGCNVYCTVSRNTGV